MVQAVLVVLVSVAMGSLVGCASRSRCSPASPVVAYGDPQAPPKWEDRRKQACGFPKEADVAAINAASVTLRVLVRADGSPERVEILNDPGYGFADAATRCAMAQRFVAAADRQGVAISTWTPAMRIRFAR